MYDNTKLRLLLGSVDYTAKNMPNQARFWQYNLLLGSVDYTAKNDLDSASGHHFLPIYTFRSSNL